jgi:excisionase family DNA binding protein
MDNRPKSAIVDDGHEGDASPSDLLTADEVIDRLLEDANLRRVAATCVLPAVRVGTDWRFRRSDLDQWIRLQADVIPHP